MSERPGAAGGEQFPPREHPTQQLPTYRSATGYPQQQSFPGTGELPVFGGPVTGRPVDGAPDVLRPRGPHLPTVLRGIVVLVLATIVVVWRLADHPDWAVVGISVGFTAGVFFLFAAVATLLVHRSHREREFDRVLSDR